MRNSAVLAFAVMTLAAFSLTSASAQASECSGFGSIPHTSQEVTIKPGSNNYVGISFFNCKDEDIIVEISVDNLPPGWWFTIESDQKQGIDSIYLGSQEPTTSPESGGSYFILSDGATYVRTVPVYLKIGVPADVWGGLYTLKVSAFASPVSSQNNKGFSIIPKFGREFNFYIQIPAPYKPQDTTETSTPAESGEDEIIQDLKDKIDAKNKINDANSDNEDTTNDFSGYLDEEPTIIQGTDKEKGGDGLTGLTIGGLSSSSIIILVIILLVIAALLFYLRS